MEHASRVVFHLSFLEVEVTCLIVSNTPLYACVVGPRATTRRPALIVRVRMITVLELKDAVQQKLENK